MVAIGLHVNWSVRDVCVSKCWPIFALCSGGGGVRWVRYLHTHMPAAMWPRDESL